LPAAAFQAALLGDAQVLRTGKRRLKAGGSQDWMPHQMCWIASLEKRVALGC
jgi:hypothetical protein